MGDRELFGRATNPKQYDNPDMNWESHGTGIESPTRKFFWDTLVQYQALWQGKKILDIGTGIGWLPHELQKRGAATTVGLESSDNNVTLAKKFYPETTIIQGSFDKFVTDQRFDLITSVMVFSHLDNAETALKKVCELLNKEGDALIIVPNFEYNLIPKANATREIIAEDEYVISAQRSWGTLADVVRTNQKYQTLAEKAGLTCLETVPMRPTKDLIAAAPNKYAHLADQPITDLLHFKKTK